MTSFAIGEIGERTVASVRKEKGGFVLALQHFAKGRGDDVRFELRLSDVQAAQITSFWKRVNA